MASPSYEGDPRNSFQILCLAVLIISLIPTGLAVVNRSGNVANNVANMGSNVVNNVANIENYVVNKTLDRVDVTTYNAENGSKITVDKKENDFQNGTTYGEEEKGRERGEEERKEVEEGGVGGRRGGRREEGKYLKNNVTEVDFLLERSESVKREGIYPYHHHHHHYSPHHVEYEEDHYIQDDRHHPLNFPQHHHDSPHHEYPRPVHHHPSPHHHSGLPYDIAVKAALGPLVGVALLGVVASLVANPVLLQLGVVGAGKRRRRRRHTAHPALDLSVITGLLSQVPKSSYLLSQERSLVENYMRCSGLLNSIQDGCVLRLACELWSENSKLFQSQRNVVRRTLSEIMASDLIPDHIRGMIYKASQHGKLLGQCEQYHCKRFQGENVENLEKF
ncbi:uncharacterized protein LOC120354162 isoform X2 [Nilaparvata lugens]|uniref:uncharacterized protein LOC120354162 isoform X2 n=1 Tax=Nilaparvata lugens TaxID=108931 RepID=UPI00193E6840|nr:uncharacterized protein LOC120354162 isoform X2 [Nilaparvata lugens]